MSCSQRKNNTPCLVSAIERYDGPPFRVLRKYLRDAQEPARNLDIYVLSAKYGLIDGGMKIGAYDQLMTNSRVLELKDEVERQFRNLIIPQLYKSIFLSMGKMYLRTLEDIEKKLDPDTELVLSLSGSGRKLTELKDWLWGQKTASDTQVEKETAVQISMFPQAVVLRGNKVELTTIQAISILIEALGRDPKTAREIRLWYADVNGEKISPKWAAKELFDLPVGAFSSDEARRALRGLGINCRRA